MKDRIPTKPGRVLITPEDGSLPYYAVMTRADEPEQEGTILNKQNLLTDETAAHYGLDGSAVPDDVLMILGEGATTEGSAEALTLNLSKFSLHDGAKVKFKPHVAMKAGVTLNVNGTGAKAIVSPNGKPAGNGYNAGVWVEVIYSAENDFFVLGGKGAGGQSYAGTLAHSKTFEFLMGWYAYPTIYKRLS